MQSDGIVRPETRTFSHSNSFIPTRWAGKEGQEELHKGAEVGVQAGPNGGLFFHLFLSMSIFARF